MADSPEATPEGKVSDEEKPTAASVQPRSAWARGPPKSLFDERPPEAQPSGGAGSSKDRGSAKGSSWAMQKGKVASKGSYGGPWGGAQDYDPSDVGASMASQDGYVESWGAWDYDPSEGGWEAKGYHGYQGKGKLSKNHNADVGDAEGQMWPPPAHGRARSGNPEIADDESVLWPPPAQAQGDDWSSDPNQANQDPYEGKGKGVPYWMPPYGSPYADSSGLGPMYDPPESMMPPSALQASAKQIIDAFCRLDGTWRGFGAYGQRQWHEVILEPVVGDPEQTRLLCRTWTDGREGEQRKMIYYSEGNILFGNGQIYLDTIGPRRAIWKDWHEPDMEWQWLRGW